MPIDVITSDKIKLTIEEAGALGRQALERIGLSQEDAGTVTDHLVDNMMCGYDFAGLPRILAIAESPELQKPRRPVSVVHETPISAVVDGGNNVGYISLVKAVDIAIEKAKASGISVVGVNNSWFSGRNAYYLEKISRAGFVGFHTASGPGLVVPIGATRPALGTNPLSFAFPGKPDPLIFDMGTAMTMWGEVLLMALLNQEFPEGVGVDKDGKPTISARAIAKGGVLPFAGHKGYGLSVMVQAFGVLAGAKARAGEVLDSGFFFIALSPDLLMPSAEFHRQLAEMTSKIKSLPRQPGVSEIRIPSERSFREREIHREEGVLLDRAVHERLLAL